MTPCIKWGGCTNAKGYPIIWDNQKHGYNYAHRIMVDAQPGQIAHHVCENPGCVNRSHIEVLTDRGEHNQRHMMTECRRCSNTDWYVSGNMRKCKFCSNVDARARYKANREKDL